MIRNLCGLPVLIGLTACLALAQDPTKVEPTHYRLGFENEHVQVVYVHYGAHEKSKLHEHPAGVVVNISGGHLKFTDENGNTQVVNADRGEARWFPVHKHRVENLGDTAYDAVYIGIRGRSGEAQKMPSDADVERLLASFGLRLDHPASR